ncbi:hypothetical protein GCM10027026_42300 [Myroides odoratimimus subsp. xuanwuensis]
MPISLEPLSALAALIRLVSVLAPCRSPSATVTAPPAETAIAATPTRTGIEGRPRSIGRRAAECLTALRLPGVELGTGADERLSGVTDVLRRGPLRSAR